MKSNSLRNSWLLLLLQNTNIANVGDATGVRGSSSAGSLYLSLHTADPGDAGNQATSETSYTSYARQAVARSSSGFDVSGNVGNLHAASSFPACTGGSATITYFGIGTASSGNGVLLYSGPVGSNQGEFTGLASNDTITCPAVSGVAVADQVSFYPLPGGALPTGITQGTLYYVKTISGTAITISTTNGGATLDITADGSGIMFRHSPISISSGVTPQLTTSTTITEF